MTLLPQGRLARLADGSAVAEMGGTAVMATVCRCGDIASCGVTSIIIITITTSIAIITITTTITIINLIPRGKQGQGFLPLTVDYRCV